MMWIYLTNIQWRNKVLATDGNDYNADTLLSHRCIKKRNIFCTESDRNICSNCSVVVMMVKFSCEIKPVISIHGLPPSPDLLPAKNGEEPTMQFLLEVMEILTNYVRKTFDRSTKVLDFHHPHQLLEGIEGFNLELCDQPESLEQILVDCRDTLKYGVRTGTSLNHSLDRRHDTSEQFRFNPLAEGPNNGSLAVLRYELTTFWSVSNPETFLPPSQCSQDKVKVHNKIRIQPFDIWLMTSCP